MPVAVLLVEGELDEQVLVSWKPPRMTVELGAPTFTFDIVEAVKSMIHLDIAGHRNDINGIFHIAIGS